jgi:hypothetical protein
MRPALLGLSLAAVVAAISAAEPGLRIVTRETTPHDTFERTEYVQSDRSRIESRMIAAPGRQEARAHGIEEHRSALIRRCDLEKIVILNYDDRTYGTASLKSRPTAVERFLAFVWSRKAPEPKSPNLLIETTTVQTGERKMIFGHTARRVVTTRRQIPLGVAVGAAGETVTDGWYVDLETRPSCERFTTGRFVASGFVVSSVPTPEIRLIPTFKQIGAPETGFPVELTTTLRSTGGAGPSGHQRYVTHTRVVELSREPLDPALFETPRDFRPRQGRFDILADQWMRTWMTVRELLATIAR